MNIWELPKEHYNYESPISKIYGDIRNEMIRQDEENFMCTIEQMIGYKVDKDELIKALQYDRDQYNKGYKDGVKEAFIAELETIKAEIAESFSSSVSDCIYIIDNRISKLKCDNDHDCEHCDLVECPEIKEALEKNGRKFEEIVVQYPPAELCTYPEHRGKPYFSIKYEENGKHIIGFGTYKPEVISRYILEYFIAPTIIESDKAYKEVESEVENDRQRIDY